jgi:hypothetical protein
VTTYGLEAADASRVTRVLPTDGACDPITHRQDDVGEYPRDGVTTWQRLTTVPATIVRMVIRCFLFDESAMD